MQEFIGSSGQEGEDDLYQQALGLYNSGSHSEAQSVCRRILARDGAHGPTLHLIGLCFWQTGNLVSAASAFRKAIDLLPGDAALQGDLGSVETLMGEHGHAVRHFTEAVALAPDVADYHFQLGVCYERTDRPEKAEAAYRAALACDADFAPAWAELSGLLERANRMDEAREASTRALALDSGNVTASLVNAQLLLREDRIKEAIVALEHLLEWPLTPSNRAIAQKRLGIAFDSLGHYEDAFRMFFSANRITAESKLVRGPGWWTMEAIARVRTALPELLRVTAGGPDSAGEGLVFLVGFPRSGTTLLDQMLSGHSAVQVVEEKTNLRSLLSDYMSPGAELRDLVLAGEEVLQRHRLAYQSEVARWVKTGEGTQLIVDKLPLNTIFLPLIHRLFPSARYIVALRDPRDVVLSCFMSSFGINESMFNFVSLSTSAQYYDAVMSVAAESLPALGPLALSLRYEDLIDDPSRELQRMCAFLSIDREAQMLRPHEQAAGRRINTPSYYQVTRPLYGRAIGRWRNYREQLSPVLPLLEPFVGRWGYEVSS